MPGTGVHVRDAKAPDGLLIYAIGDVHGRLDLLLKMYEGIDAHRRERAASEWRIIHLGDYVDRGPNSSGVIDFLAQEQARDPRVICLAGNHDVGFLEFLAEPDLNGLFATNGGLQTATSYGARLDFLDAAFPSQYDAFRRSLPQAHVAFLHSLRFSQEFGDFYFCHAGIMPGVPLDAQEPHDLIWIRERFLDDERLHPKVIVHGHTPAREPEVRPNRINVDTGAFASGILTALVIEGNDKQLMRVIG